MRRFSATVRLAKMPLPSGMVQTPSRARPSGGEPFTWTPAMWTQPAVGSSVPLTSRSSVVLPAPLGPMRANTVDWGTTRSTPWTTSIDP